MERVRAASLKAICFGDETMNANRPSPEINGHIG
jgi:hypothetical protein